MVTKALYIGGGNAPSPITLDEMAGILKIQPDDIVFRPHDEDPRKIAKEFSKLNEDKKPRLDGTLICLYENVEESKSKLYKMLERAGAEVREGYQAIGPDDLDELDSSTLESWVNTGTVISSEDEGDDPFSSLFDEVEDEPTLPSVPAAHDQSDIDQSSVEQLSTPAPYIQRDIGNVQNSNTATVRNDEPPLPNLKNPVKAPVDPPVNAPVQQQEHSTIRPRDSRGVPPIFGSNEIPVQAQAQPASPSTAPTVPVQTNDHREQPQRIEVPRQFSRPEETPTYQSPVPVAQPPMEHSLSEELFDKSNWQRPEENSRNQQPVQPTIATRFSEAEINGGNYNQQPVQPQQYQQPPQQQNPYLGDQGWQQQQVPQNINPGFAQDVVQQHPQYVQQQQAEMQQNPPYMQRLEPNGQVVQQRVEQTYNEVGYHNPRGNVQMRHGTLVTYITASRGGCGKSSVSYIAANALAIAVKEWNAIHGDNRQVWLVEVDYGNPKLEERYSSQGRNIGNIARLYESASGVSETELINAIQANAIHDPETGLNVMACPYDLNSSQASVQWIGHAISEVVKMLRVRFNAHVILDAGTMTSAKFNPLDGVLAGPVSDVAVVVGMPENVADTQRTAELLREAPISKNIVNIHIFSNFANDKQYYEMDSKMGQFNVSGKWPVFPEIRERWVGTAASPETTGAMVVRVAQFLKNLGYEEVDSLIHDHLPTRKRRNLFDRLFKR